LRPGGHAIATSSIGGVDVRQVNVILIRKKDLQ
jgi:hypothetical protein